MPDTTPEAPGGSTTPRQRYYRKIIHISADDSPNVRLGKWQEANKRTITDEIVVPGVLPYLEYRKRRDTWDAIRQTICLDGQFYVGAEVLLYPPNWLNRAERLADNLIGVARAAKAIGVDPGEGGDPTAIAVIDELGLIEMLSKQTPDTSEITGMVLAMMNKYGVVPDNVMFDRGGGGKEHADRLRSQGYNVRTVMFGEAVTPGYRRGVVSSEARNEAKELRLVYINRRAQMYGEFREMLDPGNPANQQGGGFALPAIYTELRRQLSPIPLLYDPEGRLYLPKKNKRSPNSNERTLSDIIGCSPDQADALVVAIHCMLHKDPKVKVGAPS